MEKVSLKPKREYTVVHRHPWVFSGAVDKVSGSPSAGATVAVCDSRGTKLGYGSYSPASQIRVRMLSFDADRAPDAEFVKERVSRAISRRGDWRAPMRGVRLVNGESDGLPGVVCDAYDGWCVVQLASAGAEYWKSAIVEALVAAGAKGVYNRSDVDSRRREGLDGDSTVAGAVTGPLAGGEPPALIEIHEGGVKYFVDVRAGHKTGFYLDQREARAQVGALAAGCEVLNCFSYTGGFGLAAAAGGAKSVVNVDASQPALDLARRNFEATLGDVSQNGGAPLIAFECADVFKYLRTCRDSRRTFDMIVLDPPKFADAKALLPKAARGYKDINLLAMKLLRPGGILATFSCSGAVTPEFFDTILREAAFDAGRDFQIIGRTRQAADHPVSISFPEGLYLKGVLLRAD